MDTKRRLLIINGSIRGMDGNSGKMALAAKAFCESRGTDCSILTLADPMPAISEVADILSNHDGFFAVTGVYWNSWGSPLQRFLEVMTAYENTDAFFGKPFACAVSMDSVGGADVANRLHCAFGGLGCWSPPCTTLILSRIAQYAVESTKNLAPDPNEDVWRLSDLEVVLENLIVSLPVRANWKHWPIGRLNVTDGPWPGEGPLDLGAARFL